MKIYINVSVAYGHAIHHSVHTYWGIQLSGRFQLKDYSAESEKPRFFRMLYVGSVMNINTHEMC